MIQYISFFIHNNQRKNCLKIQNAIIVLSFSFHISDEDSDVDEITDYLSLNPCDNRNDLATSSQAIYSTAINSELNHSSSSCSSNSSAPIIVNNNNNHNHRKHKSYATVAPNKTRMTHNQQQSHSHHQMPHSQMHQASPQQQVTYIIQNRLIHFDFLRLKINKRKKNFHSE